MTGLLYSAGILLLYVIFVLARETRVSLVPGRMLVLLLSVRVGTTSTRAVVDDPRAPEYSSSMTPTLVSTWYSIN